MYVYVHVDSRCFPYLFSLFPNPFLTPPVTQTPMFMLKVPQRCRCYLYRLAETRGKGKSTLRHSKVPRSCFVRSLCVMHGLIVITGKLMAHLCHTHTHTTPNPRAYICVNETFPRTHPETTFCYSNCLTFPLTWARHTKLTAQLVESRLDPPRIC